MKTNKLLAWIAVLCVAAAAAIYGYAYWKQMYSPAPIVVQPHSKVAAANVADGTYTVYVRSVMTSPEDSTVTFSHVTYFEGAEATSSAEHEVKCEKQAIEACVPSLTRGFYVRPSGAADFTAPVTASTKIVLKDKPSASIDDLQNLVRSIEPVFDVVITGGNIVSITEKSPI